MVGFTLRTIAKILTYLLALLTLAAAWSGKVPPMLWSTPQLLALAYPYLALLTLAVGVIWLCCRRFIPAIICGLALIGGSATLLTNLPISGSKESKAGEKTFSVMTYNCIHGEDVKKHPVAQNRTFSYILHSNADIVCLQELFSLKEIPDFTPTLQDSINKAYPYQAIDPATDITVLSKFPVEKVSSGRGSSYMYAYELFRLNIYGRRVHLIGVHLASYSLSDHERHIVTGIRGPRSARSSIAEFKGSILGKMKHSYRHRSIDADSVRALINKTPGSLIVCGDFNDVPDSWTYRIIRGEDLKDAYTETGLGMMVTYNQYGFYFHIDQMLYRPDGLRALSVKRGNIDTSDHFPQTATFALTSNNQQH